MRHTLGADVARRGRHWLTSGHHRHVRGDGGSGCGWEVGLEVEMGGDEVVFGGEVFPPGDRCGNVKRERERNVTHLFAGQSAPAQR